MIERPILVRVVDRSVVKAAGPGVQLLVVALFGGLVVSTVGARVAVG
jgi:hypothetical protein